MSAKRIHRWLSASPLLMAAAAGFAAAGPGYKVVNTYKIGGEGGSDYLVADASARHLYISPATHVMVLPLALDSKTHELDLVTAKFGPTPPATPENPHPHNLFSDSFVVLFVAR